MMRAVSSISDASSRSLRAWARTFSQPGSNWDHQRVATPMYRVKLLNQLIAGK